MPPKKTAAKRTTPTSSGGLSAAERAALRETILERRTAATREQGEQAVRDAIAKMAPADRVMAQRIHAIVAESAPELSPKTWYGMPAYAKDGRVVCFFKAASKFEERYATFGFDTAANLDEGAMWPTSYALTKLTGGDEATIRALVKRAVR